MVKRKKKKYWSKIEKLEKEYRDIEYEYEIKLQQFQYLEQEFSRMKENYDEKVFEILQKAGFLNILLEKELRLLKVQIEEKDLQVKQLLVSSNLAESAKQQIEQKIQEMFGQKEEKVEQFKKDIMQIRSAHLQMIHLFN